MKQASSTFKKLLQKYYFPVFVFLALAVYSAQQLELTVPTRINNYLNDFLCMPIVLKICLYVVRYVKSNDYLKLPLLLQISVTLVFILYFEVVLPSFDTRYTADLLDLIAFTAGLLFFMGVEGWERKEGPLN